MAWFLLLNNHGQIEGPFLAGKWIGKTGTMGSHYQLHIEHLPWPISVLKFNGAVSAMRTGDDMIVTMRDPDVVGNICQLLGSRPDFHYEVQQTDAEYCIHLVKGRPGRWDKRL